MFTRCTFQWNQAQGTSEEDYGGGAVRVAGGEGNAEVSGAADGTLFANCRFIGNQAVDLAGALDIDCLAETASCTVRVVNCTFTQNHATGDAQHAGSIGGIRHELGTLVLKNTILWGNTDTDGDTTTQQARFRDDGDGSITRAYDCVEGLDDGVINSVDSPAVSPRYGRSVGD